MWNIVVQQKFFGFVFGSSVSALSDKEGNTRTIQKQAGDVKQDRDQPGRADNQKRKENNKKL